MGPAPGEAADTVAAGLLPRAVLQIFEEVERVVETHTCKVALQCVEIYMDAVVDLLSPARTGLQVGCPPCICSAVGPRSLVCVRSPLFKHDRWSVTLPARAVWTASPVCALYSYDRSATVDETGISTDS
jgi:hypothetical protein